MTRAPGRLFRPVLLLAGVAWFTACDHSSEPTAPAVLLTAGTANASASALSVTAATPAYGRDGDVALAVTITGSGFKAGAQASWKLNGGPAPDIAVKSTSYVSSTQLVATIDIGSAAQLAYYDVAVTQSDRKGIGTESSTRPDAFEVTQAIAIAGAGDLRGVNDNGEITGNGGPIYWSLSSGLLLVDAANAGFAISPLGNAISANGMPRLYTRAGAVGTAWQLTLLPVDASATDGGAHTLVADPVTGQVVLMAGQVMVSAAKHTTLTQPRLWVRQAGTGSWQMVALSTGSNTQGTIRQLSRDSIAVGMLGPRSTGSGYPGSGDQAAAWQPNGTGGWTLVTLASVLPSAAEGINGAGTLIVGASGGAAVYWTLSAGVWSAPVVLPGGCTDARAVDDSGRIAVDGCPSNSQYSQGGILVPPYSTSTMVRLGGLGNGGARVESMSPSGNWIVGIAGGTGGVYWRPF